MKQHALTLHVAKGTNRTDGWQHTTTESGALYRYKYLPSPYVHQEVGERSTITIALHGTPRGRYAIDSVTFPTDPRNQLFLKAKTRSKATIHNLNMEVQKAYCIVAVKHGNETILCDPMIGNEPRGR